MDSFLKSLKFNGTNNVPYVYVEQTINNALNHFIAQKIVNSKISVLRINIVCDENTEKYIDLLGLQSLENISITKLCKPQASFLEVQRIDSIICDLFISLGSGTINDIVKYSAHKRGIEYICVPTALSMNGYISSNASLKKDANSIKDTYPAKQPVAVFVSSDIVLDAPLAMTKAGFADMACAVTVQKDWILEDYIFKTLGRKSDYSSLYFTEVWNFFKDVYNSPNALLNKDINACRALAQSLLVSGQAMHLCGNSKPASMAEHILAHLIESQLPKQSLHGEHIALTSRVINKLQIKFVSMLMKGEFSFKSMPYNDKSFVKNISSKEADILNLHKNELLEKYKELNNISDLNEKLDELKMSDFRGFGLEIEGLSTILKAAKNYRDRFTILDLVEDIPQEAWS